MSDPEPLPYASHSERSSVHHAIKEMATGLLISGALCLFFGMILGADAPAQTKSQEEVEMWWAIDNAFFWCLRGIGVLFLLGAGLAALGKSLAPLVAIGCETLFVILMLVMAIAWTIEARVDDRFDPYVILLVVMGVVAIGSARRYWTLHRRANAAASNEPQP